MLLLLAPVSLAAGLSGLSVPEPLGAFGGAGAGGALGVALNPAAARPEVAELALDLGLLATRFRYQLAGEEISDSRGLSPIPSLGAAAPLGPLGLGLAVYAPYARAGDAPPEGSAARLYAGASTIALVEADLSLAGALGPLTLGAGLRAGRAKMASELKYDTGVLLADLLGPEAEVPMQDPFLEGTQAYDLQGTVLGLSAGARLRPARGPALDLVWRGPLSATLEGPFSLRPSDDLDVAVEGRSSLPIAFPQELIASASWRFGAWRPGGELCFTGWSSLFRLETTVSDLEIRSEDPLFQALLDSYGLTEAEFLDGLGAVPLETGMSDILSGALWVDWLGEGVQARAGAWLTPAAIPGAYLSPGNADFGTLNLRLAGARAFERLALGLALDAFLGPTRVVTGSVYSQSAGTESGIALPPADGSYMLGAGRLGLTAAWRAKGGERAGPVVAWAMLLLLAFAPALAGQGGLQARVYDGALDVARALVEGETYVFEEDELGAGYDCWDYIGVSGLNLEIPVQDVELGLEEGELSAWVRFGTIEGEDWVFYATDEDWFDSCPEFETDVYSVRLEDGILEARVDLRVEDGELVLEAEDLTIIGELDTDIDWFPDDLAMAFFEQEILEALAEQGGAMLEEELGVWLSEGVLGGAVGDYTLSLEPVRADVSPEGLELGADGRVRWTGEDGCPQDEQPENTGRAPALSFEDPGEADLALGVTEALLDELLQGLWADGWFCFTEEDLAEFVDTVQDVFDPEVGGLRATASLAEPPEVGIDEGGIALSLSGLDVAITGEDGAVSLLDATVDLAGRLELGLDAELGSFALSVRELSLDVRRLEADHLVREQGETDLAGFLERWATAWVQRQAQDMALFGSLFRGWGFVVRVDRLELEEGGAVVFLALYDEDDPEVDDQPPDTRLSVTPHAGGATLNWSGEDDRDGELAWSWSLDGGSWSSWTTERGATLTDLEPGEHEVQVVARDAWWNVDPSPATGSFLVSDGPLEEVKEEGGCGCGGGEEAGLLGPLGLLLALARRRRAAS